MNKIWIVAKSEFMRRVRSKGFILTTLLLPFALVLFGVFIVFISVSAFNEEQASTRTIAVIDETGALLSRLQDLSDESLQFVRPDEPADSLRQAVIDEVYDGYLVIPAGLVDGEGRVMYYTIDGGSAIFGDRVERELETAVEAQRLMQENISPEMLAFLNADVPVQVVKLTESGEEAGNTEFFMILGFIMGFLIFMMMIIYGSVVMQGVIDEKSSRVVEVIISSVKPFHLMMGKVLGIGAMGLTQMIAWSCLVMAGSVALGPILALFVDPSTMDLPDNPGTEEVLSEVGITIPTFSPEIFVWFVLYFLFGYLLYASFYATVGSIVESQQESQGWLLPLMLPVIIAMYTLMPQVESPHSTLAVVMSMLPLTSPISMIVRTAVADVPLWQILLSLLLLVGSFIAAIWVCSRIYRVGILMYGKKPNVKDVVRWFRYA